MGRYESHKHPFSGQMNSWAGRRVNQGREQEAKGIPCHVVKIEKDFVHVAFDTKNSIFTPPVMKMTQSFSRFGREPTQVGDKAIAVPGDYYLGGNTAFAGGQANYYPRGNLSTLSLQPLGNLNAPKRDYDQHWETGGPNGWRCKVMEDQEQKQQGQQGQSGSGSGSSGGGSPVAARANQRVMQQRNFIQFSATNGSTQSNGSSSQQQQQQKQNDYTEFSFDKNGQAIVQSKDRKHYLKVDQQNKKVMLTGEGDSTIFGKQNAYLNSGSMCIVDPSAQGEESGAGWDASQQSGSGTSSGGGGGGGGLGGIGGVSVTSQMSAIPMVNPTMAPT